MTTKIEWTNETWNPITGCTKISPGCQNCYAERMARRLAGRYGYPAAPNHFGVTGHPDRLGQPYRWRKPRRVFVCSMGDLFHEDCFWSDIEEVFQVMLAHKNRKHTFQLLTKRASGMQGFVSMCYPGLDKCAPHIWLGGSVENQKYAHHRISELLRTPAAVRFVSVEPMLEPINLDDYLGFTPVSLWPTLTEELARQWIASNGPWLDWVIIGCESGPGRRPMQLEWAIDLVGRCKAAGVPVFVKQIEVNGKVSHDPSEWPAELQVREYPE